MSVKTALLLSNVIDADHQNKCLFTNKGHFHYLYWVLIGVLSKYHELYFTNSLTRLSEHISNYPVWKKMWPLWPLCCVLGHCNHLPQSASKRADRPFSSGYPSNTWVPPPPPPPREPFIQDQSIGRPMPRPVMYGRSGSPWPSCTLLQHAQTIVSTLSPSLAPPALSAASRRHRSLFINTRRPPGGTAGKLPACARIRHALSCRRPNRQRGRRGNMHEMGKRGRSLTKLVKELGVVWGRVDGHRVGVERSSWPDNWRSSVCHQPPSLLPAFPEAGVN